MANINEDDKLFVHDNKYDDEHTYKGPGDCFFCYMKHSEGKSNKEEESMILYYKYRMKKLEEEKLKQTIEKIEGEVRDIKTNKMTLLIGNGRDEIRRIKKMLNDEIQHCQTKDTIFNRTFVRVCGYIIFLLNGYLERGIINNVVIFSIIDVDYNAYKKRVIEGMNEWDMYYNTFKWQTFDLPYEPKHTFYCNDIRLHNLDDNKLIDELKDRYQNHYNWCDLYKHFDKDYKGQMKL